MIEDPFELASFRCGFMETAIKIDFLKNCRHSGDLFLYRNIDTNIDMDLYGQTQIQIYGCRYRYWLFISFKSNPVLKRRVFVNVLLDPVINVSNSHPSYIGL